MFKPTNIITVEQGTEEWHAFRAGGIGGSEVAAILGLDEWKTGLDVQRSKLGLGGPEPAGARAELGHYLEPYVAARYTERTGHKLRSQPCRVHHACPYMRSSIDRQIIGTGRDTPGILEIKTTNPWTFRRLKLMGLPRGWILQLQHYLEVWQYGWGAYAVLDRESGEMLTFEVERDKELGAYLLDSIAEWWERHIIERQPVEVEAPAEIALPEVGGELVAFDGDGEWSEAVNDLHEAAEIEASARELKEAARARVIALMEKSGADVAQGAGFRVYYREQAGRKTLDKKALIADHPDIDLDRYMKAGRPFRSFRAYPIKEVR